MWYEGVCTVPAPEEGCAPLGEIVERLKREYGAVELPEERIPSLKWVHKFNAPSHAGKPGASSPGRGPAAHPGPPISQGGPGMPAARGIVKTTRCTLPLRSR